VLREHLLDVFLQRLWQESPPENRGLSGACARFTQKASELCA
jgi:hypothetical protein